MGHVSDCVTGHEFVIGGAHYQDMRVWLGVMGLQFHLQRRDLSDSDAFLIAGRISFVAAKTSIPLRTNPLDLVKTTID